MTTSYQAGLWAEQLASWFLRMKGYRILARRYKTSVGEVDLVVRRGRTVIAVEVKKRISYVRAMESIDKRTLVRVQRALACYLTQHPQYASYTLRVDGVFFGRCFIPCHLKNVSL